MRIIKVVGFEAGCLGWGKGKADQAAATRKHCPELKVSTYLVLAGVIPPSHRAVEASRAERPTSDGDDARKSGHGEPAVVADLIDPETERILLKLRKLESALQDADETIMQEKCGRVQAEAERDAALSRLAALQQEHPVDDRQPAALAEPKLYDGKLDDRRLRAVTAAGRFGIVARDLTTLLGYPGQAQNAIKKLVPRDLQFKAGRLEYRKAGGGRPENILTLCGAHAVFDRTKRDVSDLRRQFDNEYLPAAIAALFG